MAACGVWLNFHLWIGLGLAALLIPISLSGALLVWHDQIVVFLCEVVSTVLAITGLMIWLSSRASNKADVRAAVDAASRSG